LVKIHRVLESVGLRIPGPDPSCNPHHFRCFWNEFDLEYSPSSPYAFLRRPRLGECTVAVGDRVVQVIEAPRSRTDFNTGWRTEVKTVARIEHTMLRDDLDNELEAVWTYFIFTDGQKESIDNCWPVPPELQRHPDLQNVMADLLRPFRRNPTREEVFGPEPVRQVPRSIAPELIPDKFRPGATVEHQRHGVGTIKAIRPDVDRFEVEFDGKELSLDLSWALENPSRFRILT